MKIERLEHIGVVVGSLADAGALVGESLNLTFDERIEREDLHAAFYQCGDARIELIEVLDPEARERRLGGDKARIEHIAFEVADLDATITTLERLGIRFSASPRASGTFITAFTVAETSGGIMLQFSQRIRTEV
jgi:methylmalonyl-CoA/ethylmalonyl-CoA epimerase